MSILKKSAIIIFLTLIADQALKIWVKTHMFIGEEHKIIGDWFIIHFTENNGMAFGLEIGGETGKMILSIFRIIAVIAIIWYIIILSKDKASNGFVLSMSMILAGALGNIIDSVFYGTIFNESFGQIATMFPQEGGYSSLLHGRVVDMFYFPLIDTMLPSWIPFWGGEHFVFFRPVFNIADASITIGVAIIIIFQKRFFTKDNTNNSEVGHDSVS